MGEPAEKIEPASAPTAPAESAPAPAPAPTPAPDGGGAAPAPAPGVSPEGGSAQPAPAEPNVPWGRFREVQTEYTRYRRDQAAAQQRYEQQIQTAQRDLEAHRKVKDDFTVLEQLLNNNPDIANQLYERATRGGAQPAGGQPLPQEVQVLLRDMAEVKSILTTARHEQTRQQQAHEDQMTRQQLDNSLKKLLTERKLHEGFLDQARSYVLARVAQMPDLTLEEVPYVFSEWFKPIHQALNSQVETMRNGKRADQVLPASPGAAPPMTGTPKSGALDDTTAKALEELLQQRGWNNSGT
jgi:hypothetical protein